MTQQQEMIKSNKIYDFTTVIHHAISIPMTI